MDERPLRCAVLTTHRADYATAITLVCPGLELVALDRPVLPGLDIHNPFGLPEYDRAEAILVERSWHQWLAARHPDRVSEALGRLEGLADVVIGLDGSDEFALGFPPDVVARLASVIKFEGVYRDRDLYNYVVGCWFPGANWTEKTRPRPQRYRDEDLEKIRLSLPCFMTRVAGVRRVQRRRETAGPGTIERRISGPELAVRNAAETAVGGLTGVASSRGRPLDVHHLAGLTHLQRLEAIPLLDGLSGAQGIARNQGVLGVTPEYVAGTEYGDSPLPQDARRKLIARAEPYLQDSQGRLRYLLGLRRHKVAVALAGYGELTHRHAEALLSGAALVCQDLSHVDVMFPFRNRQNVVYCRPDLSDLRLLVDELLSDDEQRRRVASHGRRSFHAWARGWRDLLDAGIEAHIREALGAPLERASRAPA